MFKYEVEYNSPCRITVVIMADSEEEAFMKAQDGTFMEQYIEILKKPSEYTRITNLDK